MAKLSELLPILTEEARAKLPRGSRRRAPVWAHRILSHGALVAVAYDPETGERLVRIARAERPTTLSGWEAWQREVQTFERHLGITGWSHEIDPNLPPAGMSVLLREAVSRKPTNENANGDRQTSAGGRMGRPRD